MGFEDELLRDKDIIWQCVSCNKCTYACPRDVNPEGVMKATAHWLELKGHTERKPSMTFDEIFSDQVFATGKIEDGLVLRQFFKRTKQSLFQDWLIALVRGLVMQLPVGLLMKFGVATLFRPRTRGWKRASAAIAEYVDEREDGRSPCARPSCAGSGVMSGKYKNVAYYPGCALEGTGHAYNRSTKELGKALGLEITELENWNCCGAMEVKNVDPKLQTYLSARNLSIAERWASTPSWRHATAAITI